MEVEKLVALARALKLRKQYEDRVRGEMAEAAQRGELRTNGQMPSWAGYTIATERVEALEREVEAGQLDL